MRRLRSVMRSEKGSAQPVGEPRGLFVILVEYLTVQSVGAKSGGVLGPAAPRMETRRARYLGPILSRRS